MSESTENIIDMSDVYYLEVYNEIEMLINFCKQRKNADIIERKIFFIQDSIGSELKRFFHLISQKNQFKMLNLDLTSKISNEKGLSSDIFNSYDNIIEKITEFLYEESENLSQSLESLELVNEKEKGKEKGKETEEQTSRIEETDKKELLDSFKKVSNSATTADEKEKEHKTTEISAKANKNNDLDGKNKNSEDNLSKKKVKKENKGQNSSFKSNSDIELKIIILDHAQFIENSDIESMKNVIYRFTELSGEISGKNIQEVPILFLIFNENVNIPREIAESSNMIFTIPYPNRIQRLEIFESIFKKMKKHTVEISELAELTDGWNILDLKQLVKAAYLKWKMVNFFEMEEEIKRMNISQENFSYESSGKSDVIVEEDISAALLEDNGENNKGTGKNKNSLETESKKDIEEEIKDNSEIIETESISKSQIPPNVEENLDSAEDFNINNIKNINEKSNNNDQNQSNYEQKTQSSESKIKKKLGFDYKIPFTIEIFRDLIKNKQVVPLRNYIPAYMVRHLNQIPLSPDVIGNNYFGVLRNQKISEDLGADNKFSSGNIHDDGSQLKEGMNKNQDFTLLRGVNINELNSFTSNQLYQYAAVNKYEELTLILEKLNQGKKLDDLDRNILADYAFILRDEPQRALMLLTNAKNRIGRIKKISK